QYRGQVPDAPPCVRGAGLHPCRIEDRFAQRAVAQGDSAAGSEGGGDTAQSHDCDRRPHPAYGVLQYHRWRVAGGEGGIGGEDDTCRDITMNELIARRRFLRNAGAALLAGLPGSRLFADEPVQVPTVLDWLERRIGEAPLTMRFQGSTAA